MSIENNVFIEITSVETLKKVHEKLNQMFLGKKVKIESELDEEKYTGIDTVNKFILTEVKNEGFNNDSRQQFAKVAQ